MKTKKAQTDKHATLKKVSFIVGIVTFVLMLIAWIPCLCWINYFNLSIAFLGGILSLVALGLGWNTGAKTKPAIALGLCIAAYWGGLIRFLISYMLMGFGII